MRWIDNPQLIVLIVRQSGQRGYGQPSGLLSRVPNRYGLSVRSRFQPRFEDRNPKILQSSVALEPKRFRLKRCDLSRVVGFQRRDPKSVLRLQRFEPLINLRALRILAPLSPTETARQSRRKKYLPLILEENVKRLTPHLGHLTRPKLFRRSSERLALSRLCDVFTRLARDPPMSSLHADTIDRAITNDPGSIRQRLGHLRIVFGRLLPKFEKVSCRSSSASDAYPVNLKDTDTRL